MNFTIEPRQLKKTSLYFIALIPDKALRKKVNLIQLDFEGRFKSIKALKVYPHITVKAPFTCSGTEKIEVLSWFSGLHLQQKPFHLYLNGFGAFHNKKAPVIYVNPVANREVLKMQRELMIGFNSILPSYVHPIDRNFKPHMTVAYRDLTPDNFSMAWQEYKNKPFYDVFDVHSIYLLEHDTKKWNIINTHKLG